MYELFNLLTENFFSPPILFFLLAVIAGLLQSNLAIPPQISQYIILFLIISIGFKGGVNIVEGENIGYTGLLTLLTGIAFSTLQPFLGYFFLRKTTYLDLPTAAALSAHYGSVSLVTFITAINFLDHYTIPYSGYIVSVFSLMEFPAIFSGLFIANSQEKKSIQQSTSLSLSLLFKRIITHDTLLLLLGSFVIGALSGNKGMKKMEGFLVFPFQGMLSLFLIDMGLLVSKHIWEFKVFNLNLILFAIYMPLLSAVLGILFSITVGLDLGTCFLLTILFASASYIVVTVAMRNSLPQAKASVYIPMTLGITFPFNILIGIPLYFAIIQKTFYYLNLI